MARLFPYEGYGFITSSEGNEIYFHRNAVLQEAFDRLKVGSDVRLVIAEGESPKVLQAID